MRAVVERLLRRLKMQNAKHLGVIIKLIVTAAIFVLCVLWASRAPGTVFVVGIPHPKCGDKYHPYPIGDVNQDCVVNFVDLALVLENWLEDNRPSGK
jgi:hypothetical protein